MKPTRKQLEQVFKAAMRVYEWEGRWGLGAIVTPYTRFLDLCHRLTATKKRRKK